MALLDQQSRTILGQLAETLSSTPWTSSELEESVRAFADEQNLKLGKIAQPLRAALTGSAASPPIFDVLVALGREESLARISDQAPHS
jgi:glutamyl-tRNA synthetase